MGGELAEPERERKVKIMGQIQGLPDLLGMV